MKSHRANRKNITFFVSVIICSTQTQIIQSKPSGLYHIPLQKFNVDEKTMEDKYANYFPDGDNNNDRDQPPKFGDIRGKRKRNLATKPYDYGTHFATIFVGNPAQAQVLAVSTESDFTAFPCVDDPSEKIDLAKESANIDKKNSFVYSESDTFRSVICGECYNEGKICDDKKATCVVSAVYRDLSRWEAFEAVDMVYVGGANVEGPLEGSDVAKEHGFSLMFGCQTLVRGFRTDDVADGIMGFSPKKTSFINQMYQEKVLNRPAFSLCFGHKAENKDELTAGSLTLGGFNPSYHSSLMIYARNTKVNDYSFSVYLRNIFLRIGGGNSVKPPVPGMKIVKVDFDDLLLNSETIGGVAFDSSAPYTLFSQLLAEPFKAAWELATGRQFTYKKVRLTEDEVKNLPTIILQFKAYPTVRNTGDDETVFLVGDLDEDHPEDILVAFPASHWMEYNSNTRMYRPRVSFENGDGSILGANMMQGHDITFDLIHDRIGFAETLSCIYDGQSETNYETEPGGFSYTDDLFTGDLDDVMNMEIDNWGADDAFLADDSLDSFGKTGKKNPSEEDKFFNSNSACNTMTCKSFVGVGYFFAVVCAWVIYKCTNVKGKVVEIFGSGNDIEELEEIDFPDYEPESNQNNSDNIDMQPLTSGM